MNQVQHAKLIQIRSHDMLIIHMTHSYLILVCNCQWTTYFLLQSCHGVLPTLTSDTFSILQTPLAFFRLQPPPSSGDALKYFLFWTPSSSPQCYHMPLSNTPSEGNPETSSDSAPSDPKSGPTFFGNSPSCSGDRATPAASDIKGWVIKVIRDVKGQWWSGSMGNAGWWPWS